MRVNLEQQENRRWIDKVLQMEAVFQYGAYCFLAYDRSMPAPLRFSFLWIISVAFAGCMNAAGQAPSVPIYKQGRREAQYEAEMGNAAKEIFSSSNVVKLAGIAEQLKRSSCQLELPQPNAAKISPRELGIAGC